MAAKVGLLLGAIAVVSLGCSSSESGFDFVGTGGSSAGGSSNGGSSNGGASGKGGTGGQSGKGGAAGDWDGGSTGGSKAEAGTEGGSGKCAGKSDGAFCEGKVLVTCAGGSVSSEKPCSQGCESSPTAKCTEPDPDFCQGKTGKWCQGDDLVNCKNNEVDSRLFCENGCKQMPTGTPDECNSVPFCQAVPAQKPSTPEVEICNYMDWKRSDDGFYLISQFGTTNDSTTMGHQTSCGILQDFYNGHGCRYSNRTKTCLDDNKDIEWVKGNVDYNYNTVIDTVNAHMDEDVPVPEYFYVACAQRFNCGTVLRMSNSENGRCVVVFAEDGGPGSTYEAADKAGRRIVDSSPAVVKYLQASKVGWASSTMMYLEYGLPGDKPGMKCKPCESTPVTQSNDQRSPWDIDHMMPTSCL